MRATTRRRRLLTTLAAAGLLAAGAPVATAPAARAQVAPPAAVYSGNATGTVAHAHVLQQGNNRLADVELALSSAAVDSAGLGTAVKNEMSRVVQPALPAKNTYARGAGVEIGISQPPDSETAQVQSAGRAEASAPPQGPTVTREITTPSVDPVLYASLLRGQATARWAGADQCVTGADLARGVGYAEDAQLLDTGGSTKAPQLDSPVLATDHPSPERGVSQSMSHLFLTAQANRPNTQGGQKVLGDDFALASETRQTIAPVTLFKGTANQVTIEVLGEWVLRAAAGGLPGTAWVHYGPGNASPDTPVLRILNAAGNETRIVTLQQVTTSSGLGVDFPAGANPLVRVKVGEPPRAIGDPSKPPVAAEDGTTAAGAVDVVRIEILEQRNSLGQVTQEAFELRVGHMEVDATVPLGGISCPGLGVTKTSDKQSVSANDEFTWTITVTNRSTCTLTDVKLTDVVDAPEAIKWELVSSEPKALDGSTKTNLTFDLGTLAPDQSKVVTMRLRILPDSGAGVFTNTATATAACGSGSDNLKVPLKAEVRINVPEVTTERVRGVEVTPSAKTGGAATAGAGFLALAMGVGLAILRRRASA